MVNKIHVLGLLKHSPAGRGQGRQTVKQTCLSETGAVKKRTHCFGRQGG